MHGKGTQTLMLSLQFCGIWFLANVFTNASLQHHSKLHVGYALCPRM